MLTQAGIAFSNEHDATDRPPICILPVWYLSFTFLDIATLKKVTNPSHVLLSSYKESTYVSTAVSSEAWAKLRAEPLILPRDV